MRLTPEDYAAVAARAALIVPGEELELALDRMAGAITQDLAGSDPLGAVRHDRRRDRGGALVAASEFSTPVGLSARDALSGGDPGR
jgi:hypothetical protein